MAQTPENPESWKDSERPREIYIQYGRRKQAHPHPNGGGGQSSPPIHEWRIPSSKGAHVRTPRRRAPCTPSAFIRGGNPPFVEGGGGGSAHPLGWGWGQGARDAFQGASVPVKTAVGGRGVGDGEGSWGMGDRDRGWGWGGGVRQKGAHVRTPGSTNRRTPYTHTHTHKAHGLPHADQRCVWGDFGCPLSAAPLLSARRERGEGSLQRRRCLSLRPTTLGLPEEATAIPREPLETDPRGPDRHRQRNAEKASVDHHRCVALLVFVVAPEGRGALAPAVVRGCGGYAGGDMCGILCYCEVLQNLRNCASPAVGPPRPHCCFVLSFCKPQP